MNRATRRPARHSRPQIDRPLDPLVRLQPHPADRILAAEQEAINDQASGGYDEITFLQIVDRLPFEAKIDTETAALQSEARQHGADAALMAEALLARAYASGPEGRGLAELETARAASVARLDDLVAEHTQHADVLRGIAEDGSGRNRTGPVPLTGRFRLWWLREQLVTMVIAVLEAVALYPVFGYVLSADDPARASENIEIGATAAIGAIAVIIAPVLLGLMLRGVPRNLEHRPWQSFGRASRFIVVAAGWLAVTWLVAQARAQLFGANTGTTLGGTGSASADGTLGVLMFGLFTLLGLLTMYHQSRHNWHAAEVVKLNGEINAARRRIADLDHQLAETLAKIAVQKAVYAHQAEVWRHYADQTLPVVGEQVKAHYRTELIRRMGDPVLTSALGTTRSPGAPAPAVAAPGETEMRR